MNREIQKQAAQEIAPRRGQGEHVQFFLNAELAGKMREKAEAIGLPLASWIRVAAIASLRRKKPLL